jgi:hypothetical protein
MHDSHSLLTNAEVEQSSIPRFKLLFLFHKKTFKLIELAQIKRSLLGLGFRGLYSYVDRVILLGLVGMSTAVVFYLVQSNHCRV